MTPANKAAWLALMDRLARKPQDVRDRVTERSCLLFYGGAASTWAEADERALAEEAGVATQKALVA